MLLAIFIRIFHFYIFGLYKNVRTKSIYKLFISSLKANTLSSLIIVTLAYYFRAFAYPRGVIIISWIVATSLIFLWRVILKLFLAFLYGDDFLIKKALIIGKDTYAQRLKLYLERDAQEKIKVQRTIDSKEISKIGDILRECYPEIIIFASPDITHKEIIEVTLQAFNVNPLCQYFVLPEMYEKTMGTILKNNIPMVGNMINILGTSFYEGWYPGVKRILDITVSILGLIVFSVLFIPLAILIKLTSPGPVIYKQRRVGLHGREFTIYKLRTMYQDAEIDGPQWAHPQDRRVTGVGKFLRRTRLDEFPQLINVLKNEMSLVGPRPERPEFTKQLIDEIPFFVERLTVKPGITGWAQINYPYAHTLQSYKEKFLLDLFYINNMSLSLDIYILVKTFWIILTGRGAY